MLKNLIVLFCVAFIAVACSKTVKGPVTGKEYKVNVGGWSDMDKYKAVGEELKKPDDTNREKNTPDECNVVDCPDSVKDGRSY